MYWKILKRIVNWQPSKKTVNEIPAKPVMHTESEKLNQQLVDLLKQYKKGDIPNEYYENAKSYIEQKIAELEND